MWAVTKSCQFIRKLIHKFYIIKGQHMEIPPEESTDLEELEQFAKMFKQKRIKLGKLIAIMSYVFL